MNKISSPNFVILLADDQAAWTTGYNGHPAALTPNLDSLAEQGMIFDRHYTPSPICMSARATIATGLYEYRTGCNFEHGRMSRAAFEQSFYALLRRSGYMTGYAGKFGFGIETDESTPTPPHAYDTEESMPVDDFDWWRGFPGQGSYETARNETLAHLADEYPHLTRALGHASGDFFDRAAQEDKPFCLTIGFKAPHDPPAPDPRFDGVFDEIDFPKPSNYGSAGAEHLSAHIRTGRQWVLFDREWQEDTFNSSCSKYFQLIHGLDHAVGMVRSELSHRSLEENTVIIFTSDNGYFCGSHHLGGKVLVYEEASRVPMLICMPGHSSIGRGQRIQQVTAHTDIAPTVLDLAGVEIPEHLDGKSLRPILESPGSTVHDTVALLNTWNMPPTQHLAVTDGRYKYLYYWYTGEGMSPTEELYDIDSDSREMNNLTQSPDYSTELQRMRRAYDDCIEHIKNTATSHNRYEHYALLFDRKTGWEQKKEIYGSFFDTWICTIPSWRGGTWFEDLDLSDYPEEVTYCFGRKRR